MKQRGFGLLVYLILAVTILGMLYGLYALVDSHWETSAGVTKGEKNVQTKWNQAVSDQHAKEEKQSAGAASNLEATRVKEKVVFRTITQAVDRIVDRPVYLAACLDADGLRLANCAIRGQGADFCKPDQPMPGIKPAPGRNRGGGLALDYELREVLPRLLGEAPGAG